jgi:hypothetical protein
MTTRALAAAAVIASVVAPLALSAAPASAATRPCWQINGGPKTIDLVVGSFTLNYVPSSADWSECVN